MHDCPAPAARRPGRLRHGVVILPEHRWADAAPVWRRAEELGFDHAWTFDHLMWRWLRDSTWFSTVPTLAAAAAVTSRLRLGTLVANPDVRHPVTFAKDVMTLDDVSGGRFVCGIGAGTGGFDAGALGAAPLSRGERTARFEEFVELTDLLLRRPETTYEGRHYRVEGAAMHPGCVQRPRVPLAVAASAERGMRVAARWGDAWITTGVPGNFRPARFDEAAGVLADQVARLEDACLAEGRDPATIDRVVVAGAQVGGVLASAASFEEAEATFAGLGFTDMVVFWPRPDGPFAGRVDVLDEIAPMLGGAQPAALAGRAP